MHLSISNIAWAAEHDPKMYRRLSDLGFQGLEIAPTRLFPQDPYSHLKEAADFRERLAGEFGLCIPSMQSIWYGRTERIAQAPDALADYTVKALAFAQAVGCPSLVFGCPRNRTVLSQEDWEANRAFLLRIADAAGDFGAVIALEPNPPIYNTNYLNTTAQALDLLRQLDHPGLKLNLDVGAMIANGEDVSLLKGNMDLIHHVHISEPGLKPIQPRPLHAQLKALLEEEGYHGFVSIEMGNQNDLSPVFQAMAYVRELFA